MTLGESAAVALRGNTNGCRALLQSCTSAGAAANTEGDVCGSGRDNASSSRPLAENSGFQSASSVIVETPAS